MSHCTSIHVWIPQERRPDHFSRLLDWLASYAKCSSIALTRPDLTYESVVPDPSAFDRHRLEELEDYQKRLEFCFELPADAPFEYLDISYASSRYPNDDPHRDSYSLSFPTISHTRHRDREPREQSRVSQYWAERLFCQCFGKSESRPLCAGVVAAALTWDYSSWSPYDCHMLYHQDACEFARDFARMLGSWRYGVAMGNTFGTDWDPTEFESSAPPTMSPMRFEPSGLFGSGTFVLEMGSFLDSLQREEVIELAQLPAAVVRELLMAVTIDSPFSFLDFGDAGAGLLGGIHSGEYLWPIYRAMRDAYFQS